MEDDPSQNKYKNIAPVKALYFSNIIMTSYVVCIQEKCRGGASNEYPQHMFSGQPC